MGDSVFLSFGTAVRRLALVAPLMVVVVFLAACERTIDQRQSSPAGPQPTATATPWPTATPKPLRLDCSEIVYSEFFVSLGEKDWFIGNCLVGPPVSNVHGQPPGLGARVMEIFSVDVSICGTGHLSSTAFHRPYQEAFSFTFRRFCSFIDPVTLTFPPPPFACGAGETIEASEVDLPYLDGRVRQEVEVFCLPAVDSEPMVAEPAGVALIDEAVWTR